MHPDICVAGLLSFQGTFGIQYLLSMGCHKRLFATRLVRMWHKTGTEHPLHNLACEHTVQQEYRIIERNYHVTLSTKHALHSRFSNLFGGRHGGRSEILLHNVQNIWRWINIKTWMKTDGAVGSILRVWRFIAKQCLSNHVSVRKEEAESSHLFSSGRKSSHHFEWSSCLEFPRFLWSRA